MKRITSAGITSYVALTAIMTLSVVNANLERYIGTVSRAREYAAEVVGDRDGSLSEQEIPAYRRLVTGNSDSSPTYPELKNFLDDIVRNAE